MRLSNPKITGDTWTILNGITKTGPKKYTIHGTLPVTSWEGLEYHIQGIAPYNGNGGPTIANGIYCQSSSTAYFAGFSQASGHDPQVRSVTQPHATGMGYYHPGGIQMLGDLFAFPLESDDDNDARVEFYDCSNLAEPRYLYTLSMPGKKASAAAMTTYTLDGAEYAMLVVYEYDHRQMYVYTAPAAGIGGSASTWTLRLTYTGDALKGDQYQCFALATQTGPDGDAVYLYGFREDEELHLFRVVTDPMWGTVGDILPNSVFTGWNGSDWRNGVGLQIVNGTTLRIFGTDKDPSGSSTNYTVGIYVWHAPGDVLPD